MKILLLIFVMVSGNLYGLSTTKEYTITSFPNIEFKNGKSRYIVSSYNKTLVFDFPIMVAPGSVIEVFGRQSYSLFYVNSSQDLIIKKQAFPFLLMITKYRIFITQKILAYYPRSGALVVALVLGNKSYLDKDFLEYIKFSGLAHLLALSGLHVVIFLGLLLYLMKKIGWTYRTIGILSIPFILFYLCLGGMAISLQRAVLFYLLGLIFLVIRIPISGKKFFVLALLINIMILPQNMFSLSFILSYVSVLGIVFLYKFWYDRMITQNIPEIIAVNLSLSLSAWVMTVPVIIYFFGYMNIVSVFSSTIVVPMMPLILVYSFVVYFLSTMGLSWGIFDILGLWMMDFLLVISQFFALIPNSVWWFSYPKITSIFITIIMVVIFIRKKNVVE